MEMGLKTRKLISSILVATTIAIPTSGVLAKESKSFDLKPGQKLSEITSNYKVDLKGTTIKISNNSNEVLNNNISLAKEESQNNKEIKVYFNGEQIEFDQQPIIVDGRTKVPFRAIFETMGTVVYYRDSDSSILGLSRDGDVIQHTVGTNKAIINGVEKTYDSVSEIRNDRTLIPVRMVADLLSAEVEWKEKEQEVEINKEIYTNDYHKKIRGIIGCVLDQNFNPEDFKRYLDYQYNNWDMDPKQVIIDVNMDLDRELVKRDFKVKSTKEVVPGLLPREEDITIVENTDSNTVLVNCFNKLDYDYVPNNMYDAGLINSNSKDYLYSGSYVVTNCFLKEEAYTNYVAMNEAYMAYMGKTYGFTQPFGFTTGERLEQNTAILSGFCNYNLSGVSADEKLKYVFGNYLYDLQTGLSFEIYLSDICKVTKYKESLGYELNESEKSTLNFYEMFTSKYYYWLKDNSYKFGFIQRYPENKENITRMIPNRTVYRYVGKEVAEIIHNENLCLEEYCAKYENPSNYKTTAESIKKILTRY